MIEYPDPKPPLPTLDILILKDLDGEQQTSARSIAGRLGEHHSNVTRWCEGFVKLGLAKRHPMDDGRMRENLVLYAPVRNRISEYLKSKSPDKRSA